MRDSQPDPRTIPPGASSRVRRVVRRMVRPVEQFLHTESASGIVLLAATVIAVGWANSRWRETYVWLWERPLGVRLDAFVFEEPLHFWINEVLMTLFFFVVGLEIRRELHRGELSTWRRAALPFAAAGGGMVAPALIYLALNLQGSAVSGWGVPMATDIAFAIGVLALLGKRVPPALRVLLLALAVIDDVGAILVIGIFYSSGFDPRGLGLALMGLLAILALQRMGVRRALAYVPAAALVWWGAHEAHVHPTLAGVIVGLLTPARAWYGTPAFVSVLARVSAQVDRLRTAREETPGQLAPHLAALSQAGREVVAPVDHLQYLLHGFVAFVVMPLFALANAGVPIDGIAIEGDRMRAFLGIMLGLLVGKPLGIVLGCVVAARVLRTPLPLGVRTPGLIVMGLAGGIGFTMSLFVTELAFDDAGLASVAKLAVLVASAIAGLLGVLVGRAALRPSAPVGAASPTEAEGSSEL